MTLEEIFIYIGLAALGAYLLYRQIKSIIENVKRERYRKKNRVAQFYGSAVKEEKGFWASFTMPKYRSQVEAIGDYGEKMVSLCLEDLDSEEYRVFNDLLIRDGVFTTQVDHVIISCYGVFVLETKNVHGNVYGGGNAEFWKQYLPDDGFRYYGSTQEHQLRNPIWQNDGHIKTLSKLVFGNEVTIRGIVVFPDSTDLKITADKPVLHMREVVPFIKQYQDVVLSSDQMAFYRGRLLEVISVSESDRKIHLENVYHSKERRDSAVAAGICPKCGNKLVLRNGRYGRFCIKMALGRPQAAHVDMYYNKFLIVLS